MDLFLQECRPNLKNSNESTKIQIVLGNEACDLDSAVSAIVTAFLLNKIQKVADIVIPVLNVKRKDLPLRTEVVYFLEETSIPIDSLICIDEIDLQELSENSNTTVVLVDHNSLAIDQVFLEPRITQIIDHHAVDNPERLTKYKTKIEAVGSCCTLVAEEIFQTNEQIMDPQIAMLLYGTILLDTICLQESAKRVTEKDKAMVSRLENYIEGISREEVFETLQRVKFDVSKLSPEHLLQKDVKFISWESKNMAIASLPVLLENVAESESFLSALKQFSTEKKLMSVILMGSKISGDNSSIKRQIGIYDTSVESLVKISNYLLGLENPSLELHPLPFSGKSVVLYEQGNTALTRKFVLPAMQNYLKCITTGRSLKLDLYKQNMNSNLNGYNEYLSPDAKPPLYQAETLDVPESPSHSTLLGVTVELEELNGGDEIENEVSEKYESFIDQEVFQTPNFRNTEKGGTLKRITVSPMVLKSECTEEKKDDDQHSLSSLSNKSDLDIFSPTDDIILPDDIDTLEEIENSDYSESFLSDPIPEMSAAEEFEEERSWKSCMVNGEEMKIDMKVIEPYRKVLSHGGYHGSTRNAIIIFSACYLPDRSRIDYEYVMDNLFLYVITTLDELVAEDYVLVYFHGATERSNMPSFGWLKRCYQMIDRRLRKNLKGLYLVHPTFWLKTIVIMTKPFISSKFSRKLKFVYSLKELSEIVPLDQVSIPDKVKHLELENIMKQCLKQMKSGKFNPGPMYSESIETLVNVFNMKL